jgi:hypothetical protein
MTKHKRYAPIYGKKPTWIIVENGNIINENPTKEELIELKNEPPKIMLYDDKEYLKERLRHFYRENGRVPTIKDFSNNPKYPSKTIYQRAFDTWIDALTEAELYDKRKVRRDKLYTDEELLNILINFDKEYGRPPTYHDMTNDHKYPDPSVYFVRFGGLEKAKRLVGLDIDSMIKKGIVETASEKGRMAEIHVLKYDEKDAKDLSGENCKSFADGMSKEGAYDVKSSPLRYNYWGFSLDKLIKYYYLLAYDKDYKKVLYKWKIPGVFTDKKYIKIGINNGYTYNIENMEKYEIRNYIQ